MKINKYMKIKKYFRIIGGNKTEAEKKFPWLKKAKFESAVIDIRENHLIWKGGVWNNGIWESGYWEDGHWEGGIWESGIWNSGYWECGFWNGGTWKGGLMWDNLKQTYVKVKFKAGKKEFEKVE